MNAVEFRVRPVIRHIVTRYVKGVESGSGSLQTLGEFDNEAYAEIVRDALAERVAPRVYALVQDTVGELNAKVFYAHDEADVQIRLKELAEKFPGESYRVYSRLVEESVLVAPVLDVSWSPL